MSARIEQLAQPKPDWMKYPDRRSVYWLDELPVESKGSTTSFALTPRWSQLSQSKRFHPSFQENRQSPMWQVMPPALRASPSERVCHLALPRSPSVGWEPDRPLLVKVPMAVRTAVPSPRVCQLSQPKCVPAPSFHSVPGMSPRQRRAVSASPRTQLLAQPKPDHPEHHPDRPVYWTVPLSARRGTPSSRVQALAVPKQRGVLCEQRDPYRVSTAALHARASPRILELSMPLSRKCSRQ